MRRFRRIRHRSRPSPTLERTHPGPFRESHSEVVHPLEYPGKILAGFRTSLPQSHGRPETIEEALKNLHKGFDSFASGPNARINGAWGGVFDVVGSLASGAARTAPRRHGDVEIPR